MRSGNHGNIRMVATDSLLGGSNEVDEWLGVPCDSHVVSDVCIANGNSSTLENFYIPTLTDCTHTHTHTHTTLTYSA